MRANVMVQFSVALLAVLPWSTGVRAAPQPYEVRAPSMVQFLIEAPLDDIEGRSREVIGKVMVDPADWEHATGRIVVSLGGFATGLALRDEDLRDQFFESSRFPQAVLTLQGFERPSASALEADDLVEAILQGTLSLHGVEKPISAPVKVLVVEKGGNFTLNVRGGFEIALADFNIQRPQRLFVKLGAVARVTFAATLVGPQAAPAAGAAPVVDQEPTLVDPPVRVARLPKKKAPAPKFIFDARTPEGAGERLFHDPQLGGVGNAVSCASCHGTHDERLGLAGADGTVPPAHSVWGAGRRPSWWRGFAKTLQDASSICARRFMGRDDDLPHDEAEALAQYVRKLSSDDGAALRYEGLYDTRQRSLDNALGGDIRRGEKLVGMYCARCHGESKVRPPLTPGLYEADWLVARVRWLDGNDANQMPPYGVDRLNDGELRDIVTYLANPAQRIFQRSRQPSTSSTKGNRGSR